MLTKTREFNMAFYITKASGEQEAFDRVKFRRSLKRAGATTEAIKNLIQDIEERTDLRTTKQIYRYALQKLKIIDRSVATRYNLKHAIAALGPTGFSFEKYIAKLFEQMGFDVTLNQIMKGACIEHEIDFVAEKNSVALLVECKFHTLHTLKSDLKIALYVHARLQDIEKFWKDTPFHGQETREAWIITNTRFSAQAIRYAECAGIKLLGWSYPAHKTLPDMISEIGLHPITALTTLKRKYQKELIQNGIVLCRELIDHPDALRSLGISMSQAELAIQEAKSVCEFPVNKY